MHQIGQINVHREQRKSFRRQMRFKSPIIFKTFG